MLGLQGVERNKAAHGSTEARFLRHLARNGTTREVDIDAFASKQLSAACRQKSFEDTVGVNVSLCSPSEPHDTFPVTEVFDTRLPAFTFSYGLLVLTF